MRIDERGQLIVSKIFVWFEEDFGATPAAVLASLRLFAAPELAAELDGRTRIDGYAYDWSLNDAATAVTLRAPPARSLASGP